MENIKSYYDSLKFCADLLDMIFKFYPEGVVCKDADLRYISVNNSYCKMFSVQSQSDILFADKNQFLSEQNIKLVHDADCEIRQNLYPLNYILNVNSRILSITSSPIIKESGFVGIISCVKDITQEEKLKESFVNKHFQYINSEKQLQFQRETFVASIGHDLKNPTIAQIRGLELMLKGAFGKLSGEQSELLGMILDSCRYMNGMLSSLLSTYRNYGGAIKLNFAEFSFTDLLNECISEMVYVARDKNLNIRTNVDGANSVYADRVQIKRVVMNLLSNAIKYAFKDTDLILSVCCDSVNLCFEFENKSPYIPEEKQKTVFARYVSYAGMHKELGVGLGLYASKKIVESHHGEIYLMSFKDDRNIFGFKIPLKQMIDCETEVVF